jgi:hypothetical protein
MTEEKKSKLQVNIDFTKFPELYADLTTMVNADDLDNSKFIRKLIRQEKLRREGKLPEQIPHPLPISTTNTSSRKTRTSTQRDAQSLAV